MRSGHWRRHGRVIALGCALGAAAAFSNAPASAGEAKGKISYKNKAGEIVVTIKHAYLFKGPDVVSGKPIRRVVLRLRMCLPNSPPAGPCCAPTVTSAKA